MVPVTRCLAWGAGDSPARPAAFRAPDGSRPGGSSGAHVGLASGAQRWCGRAVRRYFWLGLALAMGCTPLRPLDPEDDSGVPHAAQPSMEARLDAPRTLFADAVVLDAPGADVLGSDAPGFDAPGADAPGADVLSSDATIPDATLTDGGTDGGSIARADAGPDAASRDAWTPDAFSPGTDLVAWYPFDGTRDTTGRGHDLMNAGVTFAGAIGTFGTGDTLWTPHAADLSEIVAVSLWVNPEALGGGGMGRTTLIDRDGHVDLTVRLGGTLRCVWGGAAATASGTTPLTVGTWTHLACVYDGTTLTLYRNGMVEASAPLTSATLPASANLQVGQSCCTGLDPLRGQLSDVRLWRRVPSAMELSALAGAPP